MPLTPAEKQKAYRERLARARAEAEAPAPDTTPEPEEPIDIEDITEPVEAKGERAAAGAPARSPSAEDLYVAHHLEQTRLYAASFSSKEKKEGLPQRLERAEAYARWRFRAFHAGEVASL